MKVSSKFIFAAYVTATTLATPALAVSLPKEGNYDVIACWSATSNSIAPVKDIAAMSYEMLGTVVSMIPGGLGDQSSFRCVGMDTQISGRRSGGNLCEVTDPDGDKRISAFQILPDGKVTRDFLGGTGKYEGMTQTTSVALLPPMKDAKPGTFQGCNRQSGSYKLK
jgi:hypothetical protein